MTTLSDIRARVRTRLEETVPAIWADAEIDEGVTATLEVYNHLFPREASTMLAVSDGDKQVSLPSGARRVVRVTLASGVVVPQRGAPAGRTADEILAWEEFGSTLYFSRPLAAQTLTLWYLTSHDISEAPDEDVGLLVLGGVYRALQQRTVQDLKRGGPPDGVNYNLIVSRVRGEYVDALDHRQRRVRAHIVSGG